MAKGDHLVALPQGRHPARLNIQGNQLHATGAFQCDRYIGLLLYPGRTGCRRRQDERHVTAFLKPPVDGLHPPLAGLDAFRRNPDPYPELLKIAGQTMGKRFIFAVMTDEDLSGFRHEIPL